MLWKRSPRSAIASIAHSDGHGVITEYGYSTVATIGVLILLGSVGGWYLINIAWLKVAVLLLLLGFLAFTLNFFRDPDRTTPAGENLVISPADGRIVQVVDVEEDEFLKSPAILVSVFMSPLNVHVNRYPISGRVAYFRHIPGEYIVAFDEKASLRNERTHIGIERGNLRILFTQIAGFVARRIVAPVAVGDSAIAGKRFGMIRFGSRVDIYMPRSCSVNVKVGEDVVAGETVLGTID
jgi:phosphatidylserine decarboxylase